MPSKYLERNYQLQAQKRHEKFLKQDYYEQTARYFERQTTAAKQYNSWVNRGPGLYENMLEKMHRADKLQSRRESLRQLFRTDNELYNDELAEHTKKKTHKDNNAVLGVLHSKVLDEKEEENLYCLNKYRNLRHFTNSPRSTTDSFHSFNGDKKSSPVTRNRKNESQSSSFYLDNDLQRFTNKTVTDNVNLSKKTHELLRTPTKSQTNCKDINYTVNNNHQNFQYTKNPSSDLIDKNKLLTCNLTKDIQNLLLNTDENKSNNDYESSNSICETNCNNDVQEQSECNEEVDPKENQKELSSVDTDNTSTSNQSISHKSNLQCEDNHQICKPIAKFVFQDNDNQLQKQTSDVINYCRRGNSQQNMADFEQTADMSIQMFRYLLNNDLQRKIVDLCRREHLFTTKQSWVEALRLREMRNQLIILKNKNLYNNEDIQIDNEIREFALNRIKIREEITKKRIKMSNSMIYSDEAKTIWQKWNREDDELLKNDIDTVEVDYFNEFENELKNLTVCDKTRILRLYDKIMIKFNPLDENNLTTIINDANICQKQYMHYLVK